MKRLLIFSGTTEGKKLTEKLCASGISCLMSVATEYGREVVKPMDNLSIREGRLSAEEMLSLMKSEDFAAVVDATHPFATDVTQQVKIAADAAKIPYFRLSRNTSFTIADENKRHIYSAKDARDAAEILKTIDGNILLTTGSKDLSIYASDEKLKERLFVRVLPAEESLSICRENGLTGRQIIAMQGPFGVELNAAIMQQYDIKTMVTKESGSTGGFLEKLLAAERLGINVIVIENPEIQKGLSEAEVIEELEKLLSVKITEPLSISLVGIGMGSLSLLTEEARTAIQNAGIVFGAKRLLESTDEIIPAAAIKKDYYLAKDILPELISYSNNDFKANNSKEAAILFSGDTGLFSGAKALVTALNEAIEAGRLSAKINICPGISSLSYLSARLGKSYDDAAIISLHGKKEAVVPVILREEKTFLIVSGAGDLQELGKQLKAIKDLQLKVSIGYQLSYPEEWIKTGDVDLLTQCVLGGLYACIIENQNPVKRILSPKLKDSDFIRDKVPMTKEEIRWLSLCKLGLYEGAVLYDVGSGTGSISIEAAQLSEKVKVYAIEQKEEAIKLILENKNKFLAENLTLIEGEAPATFKNLPAPSHVFLGGTGGKLKEILAALLEKNTEIKVVANVISLDSLSEFTQLLNEMKVVDDEIIQVAVSRAKKAGSHHLMMAENPIYIISFTLNAKED